MTRKDRQRDLYDKYKETGCEKSHAELVDTFAGLVYKMASRMFPSGIARDDLVSEGFLGVCEGIERFNSSKSDNLAGCVYYGIREGLDNLSRGMSQPVSAPKSKRENNLRWHLSRLIQKYTEAGYCEAVCVELASKDIGVSVEHATSSLACRRGVVIDGESGPDESLLISRDPTVEEKIDSDRVDDALRDAMAGLDDRERRIILARYSDDKQVALDKLAEEFGVGRRSINHLCADAMEHLRIEMKIRGINYDDVFS